MLRNLLKMRLNSYKLNHCQVLKRIIRLTSFFIFTFNCTLSFAQEENNPPVNLAFPFRDNNGLIHDSTNFSSPLMMEMPDAVKEEVEYDPITGEYILKRTINGKVEYRPPIRMTLKEYV